MAHLHMARLVWYSVFRVTIFHLICSAFASEERVISVHTGSSSRLLQGATTRGQIDFPYCRCETYSCRCSPYGITYLGASEVTTAAAAAGTKHCFAVGYVGCAAANNTCCEALNRNVYKMSIAIGAGCTKPVMSSVEVNSRKWLSWTTSATERGTDANGTVVFGYDVRIYNMQFNMTTFPGSTVCITTTEPCSGIQQLCDSTAGTCKVAFFDTHDASRYCPVCPVSMLQPPPSPLSPQLFVCGAFDMPADTPAMENVISELTSRWVASVMGTPAVPGMGNTAECPVGLEGYNFIGWVETDDVRCPGAYSEKKCDERFRPFPPSPLPPWMPPSRPPPSLVKTHNCSQATAQTPFFLNKVESIITTDDRSGRQLVAMCTAIGAKDCNLTSRCCGMDAAKVEVIMKPSCQGALRSITVNGKEIAYSRSFYPDFTSLKFVKLPTTPEGFCYNGRCQMHRTPFLFYFERVACHASIFSSNNKCCPTYLV
ncbi:hypothetical protein VOLCADRAFT_107647 [Volvox carteri f. nagariensis]|uniref:Pherophorin domain-containing protein n=1 Tax=Volvox carteri f. nagariensis TaxID=3068 RepID=D8UFE1_VOLCA|nr:uncharacterized protein VOLCADRAFT_107647 [Volvox carteri f. nagariensis]EFJ41594.1 hypothetical protein VOLCADRAFT_107647 [Volvox carteri f. nagariensis]|eukprot:XP_002957385.1 hypothetical protein VOLCADRAFT_107647 [Volvox carteri f. nagariensis]